MTRLTTGLISAAIVALLTVAPTMAATPTLDNGSFESGLAGWTANPAPNGGYVITTSLFTTFPLTSNYAPTDGSLFALLKTDGNGSFSTLSQSFTALAGATLEFDIFFESQDATRPDLGQAFLKDAATGTVVDTLYSRQVGVNYTSNAFGAAAWSHVSYAIATPGDYVLEFRVANMGVGTQGTSADAWIGVDNIVGENIGQVIPEPVTVLSVLAGVAGLGGYARRRRLA